LSKSKAKSLELSNSTMLWRLFTRSASSSQASCSLMPRVSLRKRPTEKRICLKAKKCSAKLLRSQTLPSSSLSWIQFQSSRTPRLVQNRRLSTVRSTFKRAPKAAPTRASRVPRRACKQMSGNRLCCRLSKTPLRRRNKWQASSCLHRQRNAAFARLGTRATLSSSESRRKSPSKKPFGSKNTFFLQCPLQMSPWLFFC